MEEGGEGGDIVARPLHVIDDWGGGWLVVVVVLLVLVLVAVVVVMSDGAMTDAKE